MKIFAYRLLMVTWALPQTLVGAIVFLLYRKCIHYSYHGAIVTEWTGQNSVSLGLFVFVSANLHRREAGHPRAFRRTLVHEYGHTIQSLILGPLYFLVIGLPSFLWCGLPACERYRRKHHISYHAMYQEAWANHLGEKVTKEEACR